MYEGAAQDNKHAIAPASDTDDCGPRQPWKNPQGSRPLGVLFGDVELIGSVPPRTTRATATLGSTAVSSCLRGVTATAASCAGGYGVRGTCLESVCDQMANEVVVGEREEKVAAREENKRARKSTEIIAWLGVVLTTTTAVSTGVQNGHHGADNGQTFSRASEHTRNVGYGLKHGYMPSTDMIWKHRL